MLDRQTLNLATTYTSVLSKERIMERILEVHQRRPFIWDKPSQIKGKVIKLTFVATISYFKVYQKDIYSPHQSHTDAKRHLGKREEILEVRINNRNTGNLRVNDSTEASGSKPRSNTKKNRILPAKKENKKEVEVHLRTNKSVWTKVNRVDSSISSKRVVINSNSESVCKTCNKCVNSASHEMCVVNILNSVNATSTVKIVLNKGKQI
ncbi:hypothetical protein Tco_0005929 [Tanacetum coccineum]